MLEIADLHVDYGRIAAVRGVSLTVGEGETTALVGPNGAGKSSALAAISGLVRVARGAIVLDGDSLVGLGPERIARRGVAWVPEGRRIFASMTVAENLALGATVRRDAQAVAADREALLERFPVLRTYYEAPAGKLSGGEQQQLAIARALISRPRLLILDEPSLGLAPLVVDRIFAVLSELREQGVAILLIEQNAARAVAAADRWYVVRAGAVVLSGTAERAVAIEELEAAYLGTREATG